MNILVSNLSIDIIDNDLQNLFSVFGEVSYVTIVRNKKNGQSMGIAFVEMPREMQATQAIVGLHQKEVNGQKIVVQEMPYQAGEFNN